MKKVLLTIALLVSCITSSLFALEWGGMLTNNTSVSTKNFKNIDPLEQSNELYLWANSSLTKDKSLRFSAEGMYKFSFLRQGGVNLLNNILDVNILKLSGNWTFGNKTLLLDVGRFSYADNATAYFMQKSDGINVKFNTKFVNYGFYAGYTGFQNSFTVFMEEQGEIKNDMLYNFTYAYVPLMFDITMNRVGRNQLGFQGAYFLDPNKMDNSKAYGTLFIQGPMANIGTYNANLVLGSRNFENLMFFASGSMSFYLNRYFLFNVAAAYASGDNKAFSNFTPISFVKIANLQKKNKDPISDAIVPSITVVGLFRNIVINLNEKLTMTVPGKKVVFNGLDSTLSLVYNIFSDLQVGCIGNVHTDFNNSKNNSYRLIMNVSFAF